MKYFTLIIGGTRGLGKAVVKKLLQEGHALSILSRSEQANDEENANDVLHITADLQQPAECLKKISQSIRDRGKINYLIFLQRYRGEEDCWQGELEVTLHATRIIIDHLKDEFLKIDNQDAAIVIVSSMAGKFATQGQPLSYAVAKAGLNQMVQHYAAALGPHGIRVNAVTPCSFIKEESREFYESNTSLYELYKKVIPLRRMCQAEDVANVIAFLCSDTSGFISGQNIIVDGGLSSINPESLARVASNV